MNLNKLFSNLYLQESEIKQLESIVHVRKNSEILSVQVPYNLLIETEDESRGIEVAQALFEALKKEQCGYKNCKIMSQEEAFSTKWTSSTFLIINQVDLMHPKWERLVSKFMDTPSVMKVVISKPVKSNSFFFEQILNKHIVIEDMGEEEIFLAYKDMVKKEGIPVSSAFNIRMKYFIQYTYRKSPLKNKDYVEFLKNKMYQEIFSRPIEELRQQAKSQNNKSIVQEILDNMELSIKPKEATEVLDTIYGIEGLSNFKQSMENMDQILTFDALHKTETPMMFHKVFVGEPFIGKKYAASLYARYLYSVQILSNKECAYCEEENVFSFIKEHEGQLIVLEDLGQGKEIVEYMDSLEKKTIALFLTNQNYEYSFGQTIVFENLSVKEWINNFNSLVENAGYSITSSGLEKVQTTIENMISMKQFKNWQTIQFLFEEMTKNCALENETTELKDTHLTTMFEKKTIPAGPFNQNFKNNSKKRKK